MYDRAYRATECAETGETNFHCGLDQGLETTVMHAVERAKVPDDELAACLDELGLFSGGNDNRLLLCAVFWFHEVGDVAIRAPWLLLAPIPIPTCRLMCPVPPPFFLTRTCEQVRHWIKPTGLPV